MPLADGQDFAGYTILRLLGAGGMGEVYLVQHPRLPRQEALKVLGANVTTDEEYRQRFGLEADMVATLRHPHIVTIYDRGEHDGRLWIAMDYVEGTDASRLLAERFRNGMPPAEVVRIVTAIAEALDYAHGRKLLHRDVKPANVLLGHHDSDDGRIMLADFGIARWIGKPGGLTGTNMTVGTVTYAAPEQLKGEDVDGRADQYALAATAYHLLTGKPPFSHSNPAIVIGSHLSAEPPAIGEQRPELAGVGPVFARALAKDAGDRFDRCVDFARALAAGLGLAPGGSPAGAFAAQSPPAAGPRRGGTRARHSKPQAPAGARRRRLLVPALAAVAVGLAGAGAAGAMIWSDRGLHPPPTAQDEPVAPPPPPAVAARMDLPVVVLGADCAVMGAAAVDETGAPAYCARAADGQSTVWSPQPPRLAAPTG